MQPKTALLAAIAALSFASGAAGQYYYPGQFFSPADVFFSLAGTLLLYYWLRIDAAEHLYRRPALLTVGVVAAGFIAMPWYFFRTRGFKRGLLACVLFFLCLLASTLLSGVGEYAVESARQMLRG